MVKRNATRVIDDGPVIADYRGLRTITWDSGKKGGFLP